MSWWTCNLPRQQIPTNCIAINYTCWQADNQLPQRISPIDHQRRSRHVAAGVAGKVDGEGAEVFGGAEISHGDLLQEGFGHFGMDLAPPLVGLGHEAAREDGVD